MSTATDRVEFASGSADEVLRFWLEDGLELGWPSRSMGALWFGGGESVDLDIRQRFGDLVHQAVAGGLTPWEATPLQRLALVVLLDQFTRNVFRGQARAFSGDTRAQSLALDAIDRGLGAVLPLVAQVFLAMPLMHAENMELQQRCVGFFETLSIGAPQEHAQSVQDHLDAAREHRDIIARFGRFPHRNAVLGRPDTAPEQDYLVKGRRFGQ